ncbi:MAG: PEP-CTERM sorting domain-containing protein [Sedimentisphaerales bacterium]|nr:PEP-CTERM sorting domain-containing protein [Sedimentisphaerales bacterium]
MNFSIWISILGGAVFDLGQVTINRIPPVPEPMALSLLGLGGLALWRRRW